MKKPEKVWIVFGKTGEYDDLDEWPVRVFSLEEEADVFSTKLQNIVNEACLNYPQDRCWQHPIDPNFRMGYIGTTYYVLSVPFGTIKTNTKKSVV